MDDLLTNLQHAVNSTAAHYGYSASVEVTESRLAHGIVMVKVMRAMDDYLVALGRFPEQDLPTSWNVMAGTIGQRVKAEHERLLAEENPPKMRYMFRRKRH